MNRYHFDMAQLATLFSTYANLQVNTHSELFIRVFYCLPALAGQTMCNMATNMLTTLKRYKELADDSDNRATLIKVCN